MLLRGWGVFVDDTPLLLQLEVFLGVFFAGFDAGVTAEIDAFVLIIDEEFFVDFSVLHNGASDLGVRFFTADTNEGQQSQKEKKAKLF